MNERESKRERERERKCRRNEKNINKLHIEHDLS